MYLVNDDMPLGCVYEGENGETKYCPLLNHDDVPYCQYLEDDEAAIGIDERPVYCPIIEFPSTEPEQQWIPVTPKTLPKRAGNYFVTNHNGDIARYIFLDSESSKEYWMRCAKAWMPLPEPYKEERKEDE